MKSMGPMMGMILHMLSDHAGLPDGTPEQLCDMVPLNGLFAAYFFRIGPGSLVMLGNRMHPDAGWSPERYS